MHTTGEQAGLAAAHRIIAVSHGYAWEIQTDMGGWGLAPMLRDQGSTRTCAVPKYSAKELSSPVTSWLYGQFFSVRVELSFRHLRDAPPAEPKTTPLNLPQPPLTPLDPLQSWKMRGIVNGIDTKEWNPETDKYLSNDGYSNYG
eukprot:1194601-Prorocentrum_minimum.AAC.2